MKGKRKSKLEYVGNLTFDAKPYDLASLPDNDRAARDAAAIMPNIRMAALMTHDSDKDLEQRVRESGDVNAWVDLVEEIGRAAMHKKQEYDLLMGGFCRLQTVLERIVGKEEMEKPFEH